MLWYHYGQYAVSDEMSETYSVEGDNAEFRHYLARLARSSRYLSRCDYALNCVLHLFIDCFNRRQLYKQLFPRYPANLIDFVYPPSWPLPERICHVKGTWKVSLE
jgi:hypothetical protein